METLIHPLVKDKIEKKINALKKQGNNIVFIESAILFEAGYNKWVNVKVTVNCSKETQVRRLKKKCPNDFNSKLAILASQQPLEQKRALADYVILNEGTLRNISSATDQFLKWLGARAQH